MAHVLYLADRGSPAFERRRPTIEVVCAGDSLTGWNNFRRHEPDWPFCSYPEFLQPLCETLGWDVADCGIAGEVSVNGLGQVTDYLGLFPRARWFVLSYGGNDLDKWPDLDVTIPRVVAELTAMVAAVRAGGRMVALLDVLNADESRIDPQEAETLRLTLGRHNAALRAFCSDSQVPLVGVHGRLGPGQFEDPFHPNVAGARVIAAEVFRVLREHPAPGGVAPPT